MSEDLERTPQKIKTISRTYIEDDYLEPVYDEEVYQKV